MGALCNKEGHSIENIESNKPSVNKQSSLTQGINYGKINEDDPDDLKYLIVEEGQITFDEEGNDSGKYFSRKPHVPSDGSGVTVGRGCDFSRKTPEYIGDLLRKCEFSEEYVKKYQQCSNLIGP